MTTHATTTNPPVVQDLNRRNLRHILKGFEAKDLGREIAAALRDNLGSGRAGTIILDAHDAMKGDSKWLAPSPYSAP